MVSRYENVCGKIVLQKYKKINQKINRLLRKHYSTCSRDQEFSFNIEGMFFRFKIS